MEWNHLTGSTAETTILLVSGSCCFPQLAVVDQQAQNILRQALEETGVSAQIKTLVISSALRGGISLEIIKQIGIANDPSLIMRLPAIFIDNRYVSLGLPDLDGIKEELRNTQKQRLLQKENDNEQSI